MTVGEKMRYPVFDFGALNDLLMGMVIGLVITFVIRGLLGV